MNDKLPSWKVAAAILVENQRSMHYEDLTDIVIKTGLTRLGYSAKTPYYTLHRVMKQDHPEYFKHDKPGYFSATEKARQSGEIREITAEIRDLIYQNSLLKTVKDDLNAIKQEDPYFEGEKDKRLINYYERDSRLRAKAIEIHGTTCMVPGCGFSFEAVYGSHGKDFIEVHHIIPVSLLGGKQNVNPETDLVVLCSNCHRMIHRHIDHILTIDEVGILISKNRDQRTKED